MHIKYDHPQTQQMYVGVGFLRVADDVERLECCDARAHRGRAIHPQWGALLPRQRAQQEGIEWIHGLDVRAMRPFMQ